MCKLYMNLIIHTDGSCLGNPGVGGYAAILKHDSDEYVVKGGSYEKTTNQRMELTAILKPLKLLAAYENSETYSITVYSDSVYLVKGAREWLNNWSMNGWKNSKKQDVKNMDLWKDMHKLLQLFNKVDFKWVKGHSMQNYLNNRCDEMAKEMSKKALDEKRDFVISDLPKNM